MVRPETWDTTFDPLQALSEARTALDDSAALDYTWEETTASPEASNVVHAIEMIDTVISALVYEPGNDARAEARWALTHLGHLIANVADGLTEDAVEAEAADLIGEGLDFIDRAIAMLDSPYGDRSPEFDRASWIPRLFGRVIGW